MQYPSQIMQHPFQIIQHPSQVIQHPSQVHSSHSTSLSFPHNSCTIPQKSCNIPSKSCIIPLKSCNIPPKSCIIPLKSCNIPPKSCIIPLKSCNIPLKSSTSHSSHVTSLANINHASTAAQIWLLAWQAQSIDIFWWLKKLGCAFWYRSFTAGKVVLNSTEDSCSSLKEPVALEYMILWLQRSHSMHHSWSHDELHSATYKCVWEHALFLFRGVFSHSKCSLNSLSHAKYYSRKRCLILILNIQGIYIQWYLLKLIAYIIWNKRAQIFTFIFISITWIITSVSTRDWTLI